jgi:type I restriction enzyme S subunit
MVINQQLHAFQVSEVMSEEFFMYSLSLQNKYMYQNASQTTLPYMNKTVCNRIPMIRPPKNIQDEFAKTVRFVHPIKARYQQSLTDLEALYGAVSQQAFKGELDLSRMALPAQTQHTIAASLGNQSVVPEPNMHTLPAEQDSEYEDMLLLAEPNGSTKLLRKLFDKKIDELAVDEIFDQAFFQLDVLGYFIQLYSKYTETYLDQLEQGLSSSLENIAEGYGDFGITEYEQLKKWIYDHLQSGKLKQIIDEFSNDITLVKAN